MFFGCSFSDQGELILRESASNSLSSTTGLRTKVKVEVQVLSALGCRQLMCFLELLKHPTVSREVQLRKVADQPS